MDKLGLQDMAHLIVPVSYTHLDVYKRQAGNYTWIGPKGCREVDVFLVGAGGGCSHNSGLGVPDVYKRQLLSLRCQNQQSEIDLMKEGSDKKIAQLNLDYDRELDTIRAREKEWRCV